MTYPYPPPPSPQRGALAAEADELLAVIADQVEKERIEKQKANAANQHTEACDKNLSQAKRDEHANSAPTKAASLFNTNRHHRAVIGEIEMGILNLRAVG